MGLKSVKKEKQQLKIAMLGHKHIPSREGGIEVVVGELSTRMVKLGHEVTCYNRGGHHVSGKKIYLDNLTNHKGVKLKSVPTINRRGLAAMSASFFASVRCAFGRYDVVHFHAEGPCVMIWLPHIFGKKCIATIHGLDHRRAKWGRLASAYIFFGEKMAAKYADEIIVLSRGVQQYFLNEYHRETTFIPNGVVRPQKRMANIISKNYGLNKDGYILFLGRLVPEKGLIYLIEAFKTVNTDKKLVIAGGSSDTDEFANKLRKLAEGDERIMFTGFVQGLILEELYSNAYIYVLPSTLEGMPISLLEAMSYGNCCLVSDIAECTDVVGDYAIKFKNRDTSDLQDKIQGLCFNTDLVNQYKKLSSDYICKKFNWDDITCKTIKLYRS